MSNIDQVEMSFPTVPAFTVQVEIQPTAQYGDGHYGVFALEHIPKGTKFWMWTDRVQMIHRTELEHYITTQIRRTADQKTDPSSSSHNADDDDDDMLRIQTFLRQGFVLPPSPNENIGDGDGDGMMTSPADKSTSGTPLEAADQYFYSNPTDGGRFMNHSNNPNCGPNGTLRDIYIGEELTIDYSFHGNPLWYQNICKKYGVLTEEQVAKATAATSNS
uniref:SET domain-containing protein n=1 Tax=Cyclophora tenuis TaxID=216820 RepID=A0A7S1D949_CYCTE|mmetsp:Transcript_25884/g.44032  ORF Transcript_25884/g.44032 Transcript_25884/m.44032 type:complete len:218 (+) Transcript_25884:139-792(+)